MAKKTNKIVETIVHDGDKRTNIPTAEMESLAGRDVNAPVKVTYPRGAEGLDDEKASRVADIDPQLVWRGKDKADESDLVVTAPAIYIQEKIHPKVLIDDLRRETARDENHTQAQRMLFGDFNGIPEGVDKTEYYRHEQNWSNRMILGDSLNVMASLAEREGLRGRVQCIYFDPPYGIKFNSNFQWSTGSRDVKDGDAKSVTREPEQVKAFRDTWRDGIHSYLSYIRDRLTVARDLLAESGSIFVQIGDENVHLVRIIMDEIFGTKNIISMINFRTAMTKPTKGINNVFDYILWYAKDKSTHKYHDLYIQKDFENDNDNDVDDSHSQLQASAEQDIYSFTFRGTTYNPKNGWRQPFSSLMSLAHADRLYQAGLSKTGTGTLKFIKKANDFTYKQVDNTWNQQSSEQNKKYVVQTAVKIIQRCILMTTDPGDIVLDPTCGSGTTAYVAEQWGRRWITIDTSRVALAIARARLMGARYPYYILKDSLDGQTKEAEITGRAPSTAPTYGKIRQGFVYDRVPHITLKSIANNEEIDVIYDEWMAKMEPLRARINDAAHQKYEEWELPRTAPDTWPSGAKDDLAEWWKMRLDRQREIDASISRRAESELLFDKPFEDKKKLRVAGPFTVESLSPHRVVLYQDADGNIVDPTEHIRDERAETQSFASMILDNLATAGVQQAHKEERINFVSLEPWSGKMICALGQYEEGTAVRRAGIYIGPEFGTTARSDLVEAARECGEAGFDALISCAFAYDAHAADFDKLGAVKVFRATINNDMHMTMDLKKTNTANLFVVFGEPDIEILPQDDAKIAVRVNGVDIFDPSTGSVVSSKPEEIACWFIDTDYNEESFFVRHAYFLGASDPYKPLKGAQGVTDINADVWESLRSATSRPFTKPSTGRIAVKVINHLGDEVMKVYKIDESIVDVVDANKPAHTPRSAAQKTKTHHTADTRTNSSSSLGGLETFIRPTQEELFDLLHRKYGGNTIASDGKYLLVKGEAPIMLVAHLDTVYPHPVEDIVRSEDGNIWSSPQGIGGDDRCGVYALVQCYERSPIKPWLLFTCDEEPKDKPKGVRTFVGDYKTGVLPSELDELKFLVEIDRRDSDHAVYYDCHDPSFERYIHSKGFHKEGGSYTDICDIAPALDVAAVNLSSGYYKAHSHDEPINEQINISELNSVIESVLEIISDAAQPETPRYEFISKKS